MISYLDAASGSTLLAALASGAVGFGVLWKMMTSKLRRPRRHDLGDVSSTEDVAG